MSTCCCKDGHLDFTGTTTSITSHSARLSHQSRDVDDYRGDSKKSRVPWRYRVFLSCVLQFQSSVIFKFTSIVYFRHTTHSIPSYIESKHTFISLFTTASTPHLPPQPPSLPHSTPPKPEPSYISTTPPYPKSTRSPDMTSTPTLPSSPLPKQSHAGFDKQALCLLVIIFENSYTLDVTQIISAGATPPTWRNLPLFKDEQLASHFRYAKPSSACPKDWTKTACPAVEISVEYKKMHIKDLPNLVKMYLTMSSRLPQSAFLHNK